MELFGGRGGGDNGYDGDDQEGTSSRRGGSGSRNYHRHSSYQIAILEEVFKDCPHPDDATRKRLSNDLGLEPRQIKFWFQNKRTQSKTLSERADNTALREENEKIQWENHAIREAIKTVLCTACGGPPREVLEHQQLLSLDALRIENAFLKAEHERVTTFLSDYIGKSPSQLLELSLQPPGPPGPIMESSSTPSQEMAPESSQRHNDDRHYNLDFIQGLSTNFSPNFNILDLEKSLITETAVRAMEEVIHLVRTNEPLWIKSSDDGRYVIHKESYEKLFPKACHFRNHSARIESSKATCSMKVKGNHLAEMFVDPNTWHDLFPTIVTSAKTIFVLDTGIGNGNGFVQFMYEQIHNLSPMVSSREFFIIRNCQLIEQGVWVIADVSYECLKDRNNFSHSRCWKRPSGCMIEDNPNEGCKVTWVEHVEVDDINLSHRLYRDLISTGIVFGAERWTVTLQRMCERFTYSLEDHTTITNEFGGVVTLPEGKKGLKYLAHRMVKDFSSILTMSDKMEFPQTAQTNSGCRISVRMNADCGQPSGLIVCAGTSVWLPLSPQDVFNFFRDENNRPQWDIISNGNRAHEIAHIANGDHPGNCISLIQQPFLFNENQMLILQENCTDKLGSIVVYAPIDMPSIDIVLCGGDPSSIPILPSGFIISSDGKKNSPEESTASSSRGGGGSGSSSSTNGESNKSGGGGGGTLLTVVFQILVNSYSSSTKQLQMESIQTINTLISSTVQRIKVALNCPDMEEM